ncbi:MAG: M20/M25/M40 family metallo-hydrolase [Agromyces sp.]
MTQPSGVPATSVDAVGARVQDRFPTAVAQLAQLIKIPSVSWSAFDPAHVQLSAETIADLARETGVFESVEIHRAEIEPGVLGQPAVLAHRAPKPGEPLVVLYSHHDVQPPGEPELWRSAAYEPTVRDERLYGRGSSDDKAGVITHLQALSIAREQLGEDLGFGVTLFIEGEEEAGSRSFAQFLRDHREVLAGDVIVVCDSDNVDTSQPAMTVALRGNVTFRLSLRTLEHANHSGMFGGAVPDAVMALVRLVNSFWAADGSVAIAGLSHAELDTIPYDVAQLRHETGLIGEPIGVGRLTDRMWAQPSLTVTGIDVPSVAEASNTLIPAVAARVSVRVAPGQDPHAAWDAVRSHISAHVPWGAEVSFDELDLGSPFLVDSSGPYFARMRDALTAGWGHETAEIGIGGSIPFIASLAEEFPNAEILVTAVGDPLSQPHSPNESQHLGVLRKAILSETLFLIGLAERE